MDTEHDKLAGGAPRQSAPYPGATDQMAPRPDDEMRDWVGSGLLEGRRALITGGDSGIGRAVAAAFAKEGADVTIAYLSEDDDAAHTVDLIESEGRRALCIRADLADPAECRRIVENTVDRFGGIDILVNNAATQEPVDDLAELSAEQWERTFAVNSSAVFHTTKAALEHLTSGGSVVNTGSVNGLRGNKKLIDYSAAKGAVHALTFSFAQALMERRSRVNCVAPGPVWTPLIPATFSEDEVEGFGAQAPYGRPAQPDEVAPSFVFFAADRLSSYYSGEVLAPTGGETLPG